MNSQEYFACIQGAISIRQPEDQMTPIFPGAEVDCPNTGGTGLTWADVDIDFQAVQSCQQPIAKTAELLEPGQTDTLTSFGSNVDDFFCDMSLRIRNEGQEIVFGPKGNDALGSHGDGAPIESDIKVPAGAQRFYVVLGRPVNPIVWQWNSSEAFVNLENYPYFNDGGDRPVVGDY